MDELIPLVLGAIAGAVMWYRSTGWLRFALSLLAILVSGALATVASGEYRVSWTYLLLDCGEVSLGLVVGYAAALMTPLLVHRAARCRGDTPSRDTLGG